MLIVFVEVGEKEFSKDCPVQIYLIQKEINMIIMR